MRHSRVQQDMPCSKPCLTANPLQVKEFLGAGSRQWGFLVRGLRQVEPKLEALNIPFYMTYGKAEDNVPQLCDDLGAGLLICDYVPVHEAQSWRTKVSHCSIVCAGMHPCSCLTISAVLSVLHA